MSENLENLSKCRTEIDQHFLTSSNILKMEAKLANITNEDVIFELGAGDGRLSKIILNEKPKKLLSVEIDSVWEKSLEKIKKEFNNFEFRIENGLKVMKDESFDKIIANIPYCVTEPFYKIMLKKRIKLAILIHGRSFYNQILDKNSKWFYYVNAFYKVELIKHVSGNAFFPKANTMSVLLRLSLKEKEKVKKDDVFFQKLFERENRNVKNAIIFSLVEMKWSKKQIKEKLKNLKLEGDGRLENLSNRDFLKIVEFVGTFLYE